ncbi:MAG TPA: glycosyl hydrolase family 65 protein, partial [Verrucomicrobiales bacterium]|nr:glycosyl hydrolase family 65 protein [Verrucomicrobiales bacterium]
DLIQRGHTGLEMRDGVLWFNPELPREFAGVRMRIRYQGHWLTVTVTGDTLTVSFDRGRSGAAKVGYRSEVHQMDQGETCEFAIQKPQR